MASSVAHHVTLMSKYYEELVHSLMVACSGNNTETLAIIRSYGVAPGYGFRLPSALQRVGEVQLDINTSCDVFLAPGIPFNCWPMKHNQLDELIARSGNASQHQWDSKPLPLSIAMPRVLRSAASPFPNQFTYRPYAQNFVNGNFTETFELENFPNTFKWSQLVLGHNLKLVKDIDRLKRGDPESPSISYFHYQFYEGGAGTGLGGARLPTYEAIVVGAIVRDNAGNWVSWERGVHVHCPLFASPHYLAQGQLLPSIANLGLSAHEHSPPAHDTRLRPLNPAGTLGNPHPSLPTLQPRNAHVSTAHLPLVYATDPENHRDRYYPNCDPRRELSLRQRHVYRQRFARIV